MPLPSGAKQWTVPEILEIFKVYNTQQRILDCRVVDWCEANINATIEQFEDWMHTEIDLALNFYITGIVTASRYDYPQNVADELQIYYAKKLVDLPWSVTRGPIEVLLTNDPVPNGICDDALHIIHDFIDANHPELEAFQNQAELVHPRPVVADQLITS